MIECLLTHGAVESFQKAKQLRALGAGLRVPFDFGRRASIKFTVEIGLYAQGFIACHGALLPRRSARFPSTSHEPAPAATSPCPSELLSLGRFPGRTRSEERRLGK